MTEVQNIAVLGSTGSIGVNTLDVIARQQEQYRVFALAANRNSEKLFVQCMEFEPDLAVMSDARAAQQLREKLSVTSLKTIVLHGEMAVCEVAAHESVDVVMAGIVGAAGLGSTLAAIEAGKKVLIANKEPIVMLGGLIVQKARESGAQLLPVDSEHNAIMQCLPNDFDVVKNQKADGIERILLTGSGGPFRTRALQEFDSITPQQACKHPNWVMGPKISVDSATMMNKALELIEACVLFDLGTDRIDILIHPQSIIHSMVEYIDGSVLAQMGSPDMRVPIASALAWPERIKSGAEKLDFTHLAGLEFELPDYQRYPALKLVREVIDAGGTAACVMNAANEIAVDAFIKEQIKFTDIVHLVRQSLELSDISDHVDLDSVLQADVQTRALSDKLLKQYSV